MLFSARLVRRLCLTATPLTLGMLLAGCATVADKTIANTGLLDSALKVVGLQVAKDTPADTQAEKAAAPAKVPLRLHAGNVLNTDESGNSLSLIARIYKLKDGDAFLQVPYDAFTDPATEKAALGDALIEVKEVMLKPGGKFEAVQMLAPEAQNIGIVALFRSPAEHHWRFLFNAKESAKAGITLGAHGCALSVAEGTAVGVAPETMRLAGVQCD